MASKQATVCAKLGATVSLMHNNLACSPTGWLCSVHNSVNAGGKLLLHNLTQNAGAPGPDANQVTSVRFLSLAFGAVLCVTYTNGTQIYTEDGTTMLFYAPVSDATVGDILKHHQGSCVVPHFQHIVVGTSKGSLVLVNAPGIRELAALPEANPATATSEVSDVCFSAVINSAVSVHSNGDLRVWAPQPGGAYVESGVLPRSAMAPVRVASLGTRLLVADGPGTIRLFDAATREMHAELTAHARWLTAVDVREDLATVLTVGEDTVLNVWQVEPSKGQVSLLHTSFVTDKLLTGAVFHGGPGGIAGVAVTAYDSDELFYMAGL